MTVEVDLNIHKDITVDVRVEDILYAISDLPITKKWNAIGIILNNINLEGDLTDSQRDLVKKWLTERLKAFDNEQR